LKIDKIVFSCSEPEEYSSFWNAQAALWLAMGIEPVCLLYGHQRNTTMRAGTVIECETVPGLPWSVQLTWAKFVHPLTEPDAVWMIGDIDMLPLRKDYFTSAIADYPDDTYLHLNASGIASPRVGDPNGFTRFGPQRVVKDAGRNGGADLPAHYHVAKGSAFAMYAPLEEKVRNIVESHRYGMGPMADEPRENAVTNPYWYYWCADENYSSELLWNGMQSGQVKYAGIHYDNGNDRERIDRSHWNDSANDYTYTAERVRRHAFVDVHCVRPYERQQGAIERIMALMGETN
jgi:hypothetical protein